MAVATVEREAQWGPVRGRGSRTSWGAIFSGALATLGIWVLLSSLGGAIGWTLFNPGRVPGGYGLGLFSSIWGIVAPLVSFFVGGVVAGRLSGAVTRASGALHGLVVWSLTGLALLLLGGLVLDLSGLLLSIQAGGATGLWLWGVFGALILSLLAAMLGASVGVREREALPTGGGTRTIETVPVRRRDDLVGSVPGPAARVEPSDRVIHSRSDRDADEERDHGRMERMERSFSERLHRMERRLGRAEAREPSEGERDIEPRASRTVRGEERRGHTGAVAGSAAAAGTAATLGWRRHREREEERGERREEERGARDPQAIVSGLADEVPRERWGELLEALSELHHEDAVRVEVDGRVEGRRPLIDNSPLMGLGFEPRGGEEGIDIVVGRGLELYDHRISRPLHLFFREDTRRGSSRLSIEDASRNRTLIYFSPRSEDAKRPMH